MYSMDPSLSSSLKLSPSQLYVSDIASMKSFYSDNVGLEVLASSSSTALLGHDQTGVIELVSKPNLAFAGPREAGLFHNAIVFSSRSHLSKSVGTLLTKLPDSFSGTGDHLVSEAFYFNDPEGNGLELYFDRPAESWQWHNGHVAMDTLYIDPVEYVRRHIKDADNAGKKLGHVHLRIGDIQQARAFYVDLLKFDVTADLGSALFVSVAGYHHHIGLNVWMSAGAGVRTPSLGLAEVSVHLASDEDVSQLAVRLEASSYPFTYKNGKISVYDPWKNHLIFSTIG